MLSGLLLMVQAAVLDGEFFDLFSPFDDGCVAPEVSANNGLNRVWYFCLRVPKHLVSAFGKKVIQFSLKTKDDKEAEKRGNLEDVKWDVRFQKAEEKAASGENL